MTIEEKLKNLILTRYNSVREFTLSIDMAYSTIDSIFRRGVQNATLTNIFKICKALNISADALERGEIIPVETKNDDTEKPSAINNEIVDIINNTKRQLLEPKRLLLDGSPIDSDGVQSLIDTLDIGVEMLRRKHTNK